MFTATDNEVVEPTLTSYVECFRPTRRWRRHTEERVRMASMLAERYYFIGSRRRASVEITRTLYRELEEYAEECQILVPRLERVLRRPPLVGVRYFEPYGKVYEVTFYVSYHEVAKKRRRRLEVRVYHSIPLHYSLLTLSKSLRFEESLRELLRKVLYEIEYWFAEAPNTKIRRSVKVGYRYFYDMEYLPELHGRYGGIRWCNGVGRSPLYTMLAVVFDINYNKIARIELRDVPIVEGEVVLRGTISPEGGTVRE